MTKKLNIYVQSKKRFKKEKCTREEELRKMIAKGKRDKDVTNAQRSHKKRRYINKKR